ncbi:Capsular glucan synthase [compost metagenome]
MLIEAAACGRAVVTTDVPGCRDAIEPGVSGLLVPVRDHIALANAIKKLIDDPVMRECMGKRGRELAEREFSIENVVQAHLSAYAMLEANS